MQNDRQLRRLLVINVNKFLIYSTGLSRYLQKSTAFRVQKKMIFPRPYVHEFMEFCVERFDVGLWAATEIWELADQMDPIISDKTLTLPGLKFIESIPIDMKKIQDLYPNLYLEEDVIFLDCSSSVNTSNPYYSRLYPKPFYGDIGDNFLRLTLIPYLLNLEQCEYPAHEFIQLNYPRWSEESRLGGGSKSRKVHK